MRCVRGRWLLSLLSLLSLALPGARASAAPASAAAPLDGRALLERGIARFADGKLAEARALLARARAALEAASQRARAELYLGFVDAADNRAAAARVAFRRALKLDPALHLDPHRHKPSLVKAFRAVRRQLVGSLSVEIDDASALVRVDGRPRGKSPVRVDLVAGAHRVEIYRGARLLRATTVQVAAGATSRLVLAIGAVPGTAGGARGRGAGASGGSGRGATGADGDDDRSDRRRRRPGVFTYVLGGAALAAAAVALGLGLSAKSDEDAACELLVDSGRPCGARTQVPEVDRARYAELRDRARSKALGATVSWIAAGALLAGSVVALVLEWRAPLQPAVAVTPRGALMALRWRY